MTDVTRRKPEGQIVANVGVFNTNWPS